MTRNYFDQIGQELTLLQERLIALKTENADLQQQLTVLRSGQGIMLEIAGQRFSIPFEAPSERMTMPIENPQQNKQIVQEPAYATTPALRAPNPIEQEQEEEEMDEEENQPVTPTFLEEVLIDEFAVAAANNPMAVWNGPVKKQEQIDEEKKAALRRELMGSFLLE